MLMVASQEIRPVQGNLLDKLYCKADGCCRYALAFENVGVNYGWYFIMGEDEIF